MLLGAERDTSTGIVSGRGGAAPLARRSERAQLAPATESDAGLAQQGAMIRGGVGAQLQHRTARMGCHVHLLGARVGIDMKTHWRSNDEIFGQQRNEHASPLIV